MAAQPVGTAANVPPQPGNAGLTALNAERAMLFQQMMRDPANLDLAFKYAELSSRAGDLEAAISTLERMLIFAPNVARLKLELGVLYFRLGSYKLARSYFDSALQMADVPQAVKAKIDLYRAAIEKKTETRSFSGSITFGSRYQTNANAGPQNDIVNLNGLDYILNKGALADPDTNGFVAARFHYRQLLPTQGDAFDVDLLTYGALYANHHEDNTGLAELTFGPDFSLGRFGISGADLALYGILGGVILDGRTYRQSAGAGLRLSRLFDAQDRGTFQFEYRFRDFSNSALRPTAADRTGDRFDLSGVLQHAFTNHFAVFGAVDAVRRTARQGFDSSWEIGASAGLSYSFDPLVPTLAGRWTATISAGALQRNFDTADPGINAAVAERDHEAFVRAGLTVPLAADWSVETVVDYRNVSSNYDIDAYHDTSVSLGITKRF
ncbi:MAG TPA: tetratricopeptide repeat protein [Rhizobiaceae bacterium]|nr:tetratricopeptide repeat protein [Rhizobiaceae bacterium]